MEAILKNPVDAIVFAGRQFKKNFNLDEEQRFTVYRKVWNVLTSNGPRCGEMKLNPEKGILINGSIGVGKSLLFRTMQILFKDTDRRFRWVGALELVDMLRDEEFQETRIKEMYGKALLMDLYIDDIGLEQSNFQRYGNLVNIVAEIITERYDLFVTSGGKYRTHFSSNLRTNHKESDPLAKSIETLYGDRILDRLKEMCNLITWTGQSLRK